MAEDIAKVPPDSQLEAIHSGMDNVVTDHENEKSKM